MAFPGTYNISYYKGDTFEFRIYPKNSAGEQFVLNDYTQIRFTISNVLGDTPPAGVTKTTINGFAEKRDNQYVLCAITPENGAQMIAGTTYYYDVEIGKIASPYDYVYTLLQGTVAVAEQTTPPATVPGQPTNLTVSGLTLSSGTLSWTAPTGTAPISAYNIYYVIGGVPVLKLGTVASTQTTFVATFVPPLTPDTPYTVGVRAENISGEGAMATYSGTTPSS